MFILGFTCVFLGIVIAIMFLMALAARGIAEEKQKEETEKAAIERDPENQ